jgi:alkylated DNA repair protein alkB homolog 1
MFKFNLIIGDVMIMGGRARYCYHGIAKILEHTIPEYLNDEKNKEFYQYLETKRLNLNVRQVYKVEE